MNTHQEERFPFPSPRRLVQELRLTRPPWWMVAVMVTLLIAALTPLIWLMSVRGRITSQPKVHFILDMDNQPRFGPQSSHPAFDDHRAMRPPVPGTVAQGQLAADDHFYRGYRSSSDPNSTEIEFFEGLPAGWDSTEWIARGADRYQIYCAICHGQDGRGGGTVNQRAIELEEPGWVPATDLMSVQVREMRDGKLFRTIGEGTRSMPPYRSQISVEDRWAIVAHLRQLQASMPLDSTQSNGRSTTSGNPSNTGNEP